MLTIQVLPQPEGQSAHEGFVLLGRLGGGRRYRIPKAR